MTTMRIKKRNGTEKLKFEDYKNCLQAHQLENEIIYLEKKIDVKNFIENHKEFIKSHKIILTQPANIGPQDVPRTSPSNVPRTSPKDPI